MKSNWFNLRVGKPTEIVGLYEIKVCHVFSGRARQENSDVIHISFKKEADDRDMLPYRKLIMMMKTTRLIYKKFRQDPEAYKAEVCLRFFSFETECL